MDDQVEVQCMVCNNSSFKYKCPCCSLKYCSVSCYKVHKETPCGKNVENTTVTVEIDKQGDSLPRQVLFPTDDTVLPKTLEKLRASQKLQKLLENPHLKDMIKEVDGHPNPKLMMHRAMKEPIFTEFADVCLNIVEPLEEGVLEAAT